MTGGGSGGSTRTPAMSEAVLQAAIVECARTLGYMAYHTFDSRRSTAGYPDLTLVRGNRLIFAELKSSKGEVTLAQRAWLTDLGRCAEAYVWYPRDWLDGTVETILRGRAKGETA